MTWTLHNVFHFPVTDKSTFTSGHCQRPNRNLWPFSWCAQVKSICLLLDAPPSCLWGGRIIME